MVEAKTKMSSDAQNIYQYTLEDTNTLCSGGIGFQLSHTRVRCGY